MSPPSTEVGKKGSPIAQTIVIVESPAKCKKIEEYLGPGFRCIASYGHFREIKNMSDMNVYSGYDIQYTQSVVRTKRDAVKNMKILANVVGAQNVVIATDDDREGEAIGWHICDILGLDVSTTRRIVFHEITRDAVINAMKNPGLLNMDIVRAQKCRQVIDMVVGFRISPMLWRRFTYSKNNGNSGALSAGRCQIPCLRLVYDNHIAIHNHLTGENASDSAYHIYGRFTAKNIKFDLEQSFNTREAARDVLNMTNSHSQSDDMSHMFSREDPYESTVSPPKPLNTSRLQQACSNEYSMSPSDTMSSAQRLYERGLITYMRTDATHYSPDFLETVRPHILKLFNNERYVSLSMFFLTLPPPSRKSVSKSTSRPTTSLQNAHESIRPTSIKLENLDDAEYEELSAKDKRVYKLVWRTTMESCMSNAVYSKMKCYVHCIGLTGLRYLHIASTPIFMGWQAVRYGIQLTNACSLINSVDESDEQSTSGGPQEYAYLKMLKMNSQVGFSFIRAEERVARPPQHYTEARLVRLLEEKGIGRPSTFSSLVEKIQERGYVTKMTVHGETYICMDLILTPNRYIAEEEREVVVGGERNKLVLQPIGKTVVEYLMNHFAKLFDYEYTQHMEDNLEKIATGLQRWTDPCDTILRDIDDLESNMESKDKEKYRVQLDGNREVIMGRYGPVIRTTESSNGNQNVVFESVDGHDTCSDKQSEPNEWGTNQPVVKKGKYGLYVDWNGKTIGLKGFGNRPPENISMEEIRGVLERQSNGQGPGIVRELNRDVSVRRGKTGSLYIFFKTAKMKKPEFMKMPTGVTEKNLFDVEAAELLTMLNL